VERLVAEVSAGFKGDVGVVPRQFLREFVTQLDLVEEHPDYEPMSEYGFQVSELSPEEQHVLSGASIESPDDEVDSEANGLVPAEDVW